MFSSNSGPIKQRAFRAFISYRHLDNKEDGRRWAEWIHHGLENYQIPRSLLGRLNRAGKPIPSTLFPIFRDEEEMATARPLGELVEEGLQRSEWLIVLCSPRSAESPWLNSEVERFRELGRHDRILPVLLEGEPNAAARAKVGEAIDPALECLPRALRFSLQAPASPGRSWTARERLLAFDQELAADFRPEGKTEQGYTSVGAYRSALEHRNALAAPGSRHTRRQLRDLESRYARRLKIMRLKIIAGLLDIPLVELTRRDAEARARRAFGFAVVSAAIAAVVIIFAMLAFRESNRRRELLKEASRSDAAEAQRLSQRGEWQNAVAHLDRALRYWPENLGAAAHLWNILRHEHGPSIAAPERQLPWLPHEANGRFSPDGNYLAVTDFADNFCLYDLRPNGSAHLVRQPDWQPGAFGFTEDSRRLIVAGEGSTWQVMELSSFEERKVSSAAGKPLLVKGAKPQPGSPLSPTGRAIIVGRPDGALEIDDSLTGRQQWLIPARTTPADFAVWSGNGRRIAVSWGSREVAVYDADLPASPCFAFRSSGTVWELSLDEVGEWMAVKYDHGANHPAWAIYEVAKGTERSSVARDAGWFAFAGGGSKAVYNIAGGQGATYFEDFGESESTPINLGFENASGAVFPIDGRSAVVFDMTGKIQARRLDGVGPKLTRQVLTANYAQHVLALSADGKTLASYDSGFDHNIVLWSIPSSSETFPSLPPELKPDFGATSPDGKWEASTVIQVGTVRYLGASEPPGEFNWYLNPSSKVAWTADGRTLWHWLYSEVAIPWDWQPPLSATEQESDLCTLLAGVRFDQKGDLTRLNLSERLAWRAKMSAVDGSTRWKAFFQWWLDGRATP